MLFWLYLLIAILTEVVGTAMMKASQGLTRLLPSVLMFVLYAVSFVFMAVALKKIEVGIAMPSGQGWARRSSPPSASTGSRNRSPSPR